MELASAAMETKREGFSIREYASRMRSVDVVKCWPFNPKEEESVVKSMLPPITVKKFMWWLDELQHNLHSEDDTIIHNSKKKKAPKKRSVLEIFAVAPEVERVISSSEDEGINSHQQEDGFGIDWGLKGKRNSNNKKNKEIVLNKLKKAIKKKTKNKENCAIFTLPDDQVKDIGNQSSSHKRDSMKGSCDIVPIHKKKPKPQHLGADKKKPRLQYLDGDKKKVTRKAIRLISQHPENTTRGILKSHIETFSLKNSNKDILHEAIKVNHSNKQKADKHVTFLQKDDVPRTDHFGAISDVFVGLPLNSQGELITFSSNAPPISWDFSTSLKEQLNLFPMEGYLKENPIVFDQSKFGQSIESQSSGNEKAQSTLRLMGKELKIGGSGFEGSKDGHIWKDKHVINKNIPSLGKMGDTFSPSQFNQRYESMYSFPTFDYKTNSIYQNDFIRRTNPDSFLVQRTNPVEKLVPDFRSMVRNKQNLINGPRSSIRFPFMHPDLEGHVQSPRRQNRPPLFFDISENRSYCNSLETNNHWADYSSLSPTPAAFSLYCGSSSVCPTTRSSTLFSQKAPMIRYPGPVVLPISSQQKKSRHRAMI